jgi:hypothetical protein
MYLIKRTTEKGSKGFDLDKMLGFECPADQSFVELSWVDGSKTKFVGTEAQGLLEFLHRNTSHQLVQEPKEIKKEVK